MEAAEILTKWAKSSGLSLPALIGRLTVIVADLKRAAETFGIEPAIVVAKAIKESRLKPDAQSQKTSAAGLMQIVADTWDEIVKKIKESKGIDIPPFNEAKYNPFYNALVGTFYIKSLMSDVAKTLALVEPDTIEIWTDIAYHLGLGGAIQFSKFLKANGWTIHNYDKNAVFDLKNKKGKIIASLKLSEIIPRAKDVTSGESKLLALFLLGSLSKPGKAIISFIFIGIIAMLAYLLFFKQGDSHGKT